MTAPAAITPGMRVSLLVSDQPDPVDATVERVYTDAIGDEVAELTLWDGSTSHQCTRFLTPLPVYDSMDAMLADLDAEPCNVCGDPGRLVTDDGYAVTPVTDGYVMCDADDEAHSMVRATFGSRTEAAR